MLDVISSAKNTQWFAFPSLCTKYTYSHVANEAVDFQTIPGRNYFAEFNRKSGFELLRTVTKDDVVSIQRVKKRQIEDLSCGAVSKLYGSELAVGMSNGFIQIFNIEKGDFMPFKFKPDKIGNNVIGIDYSNDDAYMAAVYESADICLFGLKTGVKTNSFTLDGSSTLIRFHPVKKFALAVASYQGAVTMLDVQTKKKIFFEKAAHSAPTRDISMFSTSQDVFISCGFDCNINVYDLRKRVMVQQYTQPHPMSTVCVSPCGTFCVGGNLKGDVISFDFRNMKEPIDIKRAHDSAVVRVAFIPAIGDASASMFGQTINAVPMTVDKSPCMKSSPNPDGLDSFAKFVEVCRKDNVPSVNESRASVHDSWADMMPVRCKHDLTNLTGIDTPVKSSPNSIIIRSKRSTRSTFAQSIIVEGEELTTSPEIVKSSVNGDDKFTDSETNELMEKMNANSQNEERKQVTGRRSTFSETFARNLRSTNTSTPPELKIKSVLSPRDLKPKNCLHEIIEEESIQTEQVSPDAGNGAKVVTMSKSDLQILVNGMIGEEISNFQQRISTNLQSFSESIKNRIDQRFQAMEQNNKEAQANYYEKGVVGCVNLHNNLHPLQDILEKALVLLIRQDEFALNYFQTRGECISLRQQLGKYPKTGVDQSNI